VEGVQGDILFVRHSPLRVAELVPGQPDEPTTVAVPEFLGRPAISAFEPVEQE
jgi:hypothetical protein